MKTELDEQTRQFIAHLDQLAEKLLPKRRPRDVGQPECSQQELRVLTALGLKGKVTMSDLAGALNVPLSTATHTVDRLVTKGLVGRTRVKQDRRIVQIAFSRKGRRINQFVIESRLTAARSMLTALQPREREILIQRMEKMAGSDGTGGGRGIRTPE